MTDVGWLTRSLTDVPGHDAWLTAAEREVLAGLRFSKRRADWRLGRWTAKAAVSAWLDIAPAEVAILAAGDGAPAAWLGAVPAPVGISISHRAGRGLAVVTAAGRTVGCDLEIVEPRSDAFVAEWLAPEEQRLVAAAGERQRARLVNAIWTAKEAAAKARREGLRLDVRGAVARLDAPGGQAAGWRPLSVHWRSEGLRSDGWWRADGDWTMAIAGHPPPPPPRPLA